MLTFAPSVGIAAGLITLCGEIWYNASILSGRTRPDRAAWWVMSFSWILLGSSHYAVGGVATVIVPAIFTASVLLTAILATLRGVDFVFGTFEKAMLAVVTVSFVLWWCLDAPLVALWTNLCINASGMLLVIRKTIAHPGSEALGPWTLTMLGDLFNLLAIGHAPDEWVLPVYLFLSNGCMLMVIVSGHRRARPAAR